MAKKRLIDSDVACKGCVQYETDLSCENCVVNDAPTIDAVEVVRCKDCKFGDWDSEPDDAMVCMRTKDGFWRSGNDFCSFGERKEGADL